MKTVKMKFTVEVTIECSNPKSFESQKEFDNDDAKAMKPYLKGKLEEAMDGSWQYAARVASSKVRSI